MPNYCRNILKISCSDQDLMTKIKELVLSFDDQCGPIYTMDKLLPRPAKYGPYTGFPNFAYTWGISVWGTYWDAIDPIITEDNEILTLDYDTACRPNAKWVKTLCKILDDMFFWEDQDTLTLEHNYWEHGLGFGGRLLWTPRSKIKYKEYDIVEYAYLHMEGLHEYLVNRGHEPYNQGWEKFNKQLEKYANPYPE